MARKKVRNPKKAELLADQAAALAEYAAKALIAAEKLRIKGKPVEGLQLEETERTVLANLPTLAVTIRKKLAKADTAFTVAEVASMVMAVADSSIDAEPNQQLDLLLVAKNLTGCLQDNIVMPDLPAKAKKPKSADTAFQFKITLLESQPPIWRRIQVKDCTLDKLHEHIQTSMGWTNSHLHRFKIGDHNYADPQLMEEDFEDFGYIDSTTKKISAILPKSGKPFRFEYQYDFGDNWQHEVLFEGCVRAEPSRKYPLCVEGERACPPEDVGGIGGYEEFLEAIRNKNPKQHEELLEWVGGWFDPEEFDPATATKAMKKGPADWRKEAGW